MDFKAISTVTTHEDGSSWSARCHLLVANFVAGELTIHEVDDLGSLGVSDSFQQEFVSWAQEQVSKLPAAWLDAHCAMYGVNKLDTWPVIIAFSDGRSKQTVKFRM